VHEGVTISYRGRIHAVGSGPGYYGIWLASAPLPHPVEWWPQTPQGWHDAWSRFTALEPIDAIVAVGEAGQDSTGQDSTGQDSTGQDSTAQDSTAQGSTVERWWPADDVPSSIATTTAATKPVVGRSRQLIAPILIAAGILFGIVGLFPGYLGGASLAQQPDELVPHAMYLAAWALSAVLLLLGPRSRPVPERSADGKLPQAGALLGIGTSAVTFGLFFADLGTVMSGGSQLAGSGLVLSLIGWLACAAGSTVAVSLWRAGSPRRARGTEAVLALALTAVAVLGAAIAFAPSWDRYTLTTSAGSAVSLTAGNTFANSAPVIAGDVAVMVLLVAAVLVAALWQPVRLGAALLAGAIIPMVAQAISAVVQIGSAPSPSQFGYSQAQARQAGLTITSGLTPAFWIYCAFVLAVVLIGARMLTTPDSARAAAEGVASPIGAGPSTPIGAGPSTAAPPGPAQLT
jgi:hypothetical protein